MSEDPKARQIEEAVSAFRERNPSGRILPSPAWRDLPLEDRDELFVRQLESRIVERALNPVGLSSTVLSVLARLKNPST